jgi:hypothetical protein
MFSITGNLQSDPNTVRAFIGYYHTTVPLAPATISFTLNNLNQLPAFPSSDSVDITVYKIPNLEFDTLPQPILISQFRAANGPVIPFSALPMDTNSVIYADITSASQSMALSNISTSESISVFPNPVEQLFTVQLPEACSDVSVYDCFGRTISTLHNVAGTIEIDCSGFPAGIYFLQATGSATLLTTTFIKN